jgi:hypothetical protein
MTTLVALVACLAMAGIPGALVATGARRAAARGGAVAPVVAFGTLVGGVGTVVAAATVAANAGRSHWTQARLPPVALLTVLLVPIALATLAGRAARRLDHVRPLEGAIPPSLGLHAGERATWSGSCRSPWAVPAVAGSLGAAALLLVAGSRTLAGVLLVVGIALVPLVGLEVRVGADGVVVESSVVHRLRRRIPLQEIAVANAIHLEPMAWGGWGYRGSHALTGRAAIVLRRGPAVVLDLVDGGRLAVTVDDAERGAGLVNDLPPPRPRAAARELMRLTPLVGTKPWFGSRRRPCPQRRLRRD